MKSKGFAVEAEVEAFLTTQGLIPIQRNFMCRRGEIDLIMLDQDEIVFIEVRFRKNNHHGSPEESITQAKIKKLIFTAKAYLHSNSRWDAPCRFDIVGVTETKDRRRLLNWIKDAIST